MTTFLDMLTEKPGLNVLSDIELPVQWVSIKGIQTPKGKTFKFHSGDRFELVNKDNTTATIKLLGGAEMQMIISRKQFDSLEKDAKR